MSEHVKQAAEEAEKIFTATEESLLKDWDRKENLQFPNLLRYVVSRLNADSKMATKIDLYMRAFVREHSDYYVSRGAKGGIMLRSVFNARENKKAAVEAAKQVIKQQIADKVATMTAIPSTVTVVDSESEDEIEVDASEVEEINV